MIPKQNGPYDIDRLEKLTKDLLLNHSLIVASNRGPVEHQVVGDHMNANAAGGGVATVLSSISRFVPFTWIASALSDGDRLAARMSDVTMIQTDLGNHDLSLRYVLTSKEVYEKYYNVFSNPFLWFLQHYMWNLPYTPNVDQLIYDAWEKGYIPVNLAFADSIVEEAGGPSTTPIILLHDYHLYLVGGEIRKRIPGSIIQHFIHIPWPSPRYWTMMPAHMRTEILQSMCSCNILGFQSTNDAENFLLTCEEFLPEAKIDTHSFTVQIRDRSVLVRNYPVSVDVAELNRLVVSVEVKKYARDLRALISDKAAIVRVDRLEPSKNIVRGFRAFEMLLGRYPELLGNVTFLAFLFRSREDIREYQSYYNEVTDIIDRINSTFGQEDWAPIHLFIEDNRAKAIAGMSLSDVYLANPVIDGMNLVAKEFAIVNTKNGLLILSEAAGAYEQLKTASIAVSPSDIEGTTRALYEALTMEENARVHQSQELKEIVEKRDITHWLYSQIEDLSTLVVRTTE